MQKMVVVVSVVCVCVACPILVMAQLGYEMSGLKKSVDYNG